jgi:hypothetical protein
MPGYPLTIDTLMRCPHGGVVTIQPTQVSVAIDGALVGTDDDVMMVQACPFTLANGQPSPCLIVQWTNVATQVMVDGIPVQLQAGGPGTGLGQCIAATGNPQGPPSVSQIQLVAQGV